MTITLYYKYLKHDIDQWTYRLGDARIQNADLRNEAQASSESTDVSFYRRKIEDGVAHLRAHFSDEMENSATDSNDILNTEEASWVFTFKEDSGITTDSTAIAELMHRFVLFHVIRDWAGIYAPDASATAASLLQEAEDALDEGAYSLELPTKHRRDLYTEEDSVKIV